MSLMFETFIIGIYLFLILEFLETIITFAPLIKASFTNFEHTLPKYKPNNSK